MVRFIVVGGVANISYGAVFLLMGVTSHVGLHTRNLCGTLLSTVIANELHRRFTFRATARQHWLRAQVAGSTVALIGAGATSLILLGRTQVAPRAAELTTLLVIYGVGVGIGLTRFVILRAVLAPSTRATGP